MPRRALPLLVLCALCSLGQSDTTARPLSLVEAVQLALQHNLGIAAQRAQRAGADAAVWGAGTDFEPELWGSYRHGDSRTPPSSSVDGDADAIFATGSDVASVGVSQRLPTGTSVELAISSSRTESGLGTAVQPLLVRNSLTISVRQSLLAGFGFDPRVGSADLLRAALAVEESEQRLRAALASTVQDVEDAYWALVLARSRLLVREQALQLAQKQVELTQRQIELGVLPPADRISAELTLAQQVLVMVEAEAAIDTQSDALRVVLGLPMAEWDQPITPTDLPAREAPLPSLADALVQAEGARPELAARRAMVRSSELTLVGARNRLLPTLELDAGIGLVGQAPDGAGAWSQLATAEARSLSVGLDLSWRPAMLRGVGGLQAARAGLRSAELGLQEEQQAVAIELRAAHRALVSAARSLEASGRLRELAERSIDVEQRRFLEGSSNNFLVGQRQSDLAQAQLAELSAVVGLRRAHTAWERATGTLLDARGISLTP